MRSLHLPIALAAALCTLACSTTTDVGDSAESATTRVDTLNAAYGVASPRLAALDAIGGRRPALVLRMERFTVEGAKIIYYLDAQPGRATMTVDERNDGGGIRSHTIGALTLVRYEPSVWVDNVEVRKERFVPVDPSSTVQDGPYLLVEQACLSGACIIAF